MCLVCYFADVSDLFCVLMLFCLLVGCRLDCLVRYLLLICSGCCSVVFCGVLTLLVVLIVLWLRFVFVMLCFPSLIIYFMVCLYAIVFWVCLLVHSWGWMVCCYLRWFGLVVFCWGYVVLSCRLVLLQFGCLGDFDLRVASWCWVIGYCVLVVRLVGLGLIGLRTAVALFAIICLLVIW